MKRFGIDVSKWQGNFDFDRAKEEGVEFVILRGAYSTGKDVKFEKYYSDCKLYDIPVGVYQYSMAQTVEQAKKEAEFLYNNVLRGKKFEYPIYIDIEDRTQLALSRNLLTEIAETWCAYLEAKKYYVGIYAGKYTLLHNMDDTRLKRYTHWIPMWAEECTYEDKSVLGMWQFGGEKNVLRKNTVAGVVCDQNYAYVDFPAVIKAKRLNGYTNTPVTQKPVTKPVNASQTALKIGDKVKLKAGAKYSNGQKIPVWVFEKTLYIRSKELSGGVYNVSTLKTGAITGRVNKIYISKA